MKEHTFESLQREIDDLIARSPADGMRIGEWVAARMLEAAARGLRDSGGRDREDGLDGDD